MSKFEAKIIDIQNQHRLNIVKFLAFGQTLTMMSLELNESIKIDSKVILSIKPTSVAIGKNFFGEISYSNQIKSNIKDINYGELLCDISLDVDGTILESIITKSSAQRLELKNGDEVTAFIKASDLSIFEVCDG